MIPLWPAFKSSRLSSFVCWNIECFLKLERIIYLSKLETFKWLLRLYRLDIWFLSDSVRVLNAFISWGKYS
jgi:hypothetical protein